ncbi:hypothetical protein [Natrinema halophilum]|uniref:Uncharacterized protein n=1 Tax=Natrinema halophilum TaxID=1699371 RepID=A0A7D5GMJ3_9EURY|nr:hypothetical protein [Natrinema halophilum]QLG50172.1 hypothetical protein HYG82_15570 [Natrinema halophilum]
MSAYETLNVRIKGDAGCEGEHFAVAIGGEFESLRWLSGDSVGTCFSRVSIDMDDDGIEASNPRELSVNFWNGRNERGAIEIRKIWFE